MSGPEPTDVIVGVNEQKQTRWNLAMPVVTLPFDGRVLDRVVHLRALASVQVLAALDQSGADVTLIADAVGNLRVAPGFLPVWTEYVGVVRVRNVNAKTDRLIEITCELNGLPSQLPSGPTA